MTNLSGKADLKLIAELLQVNYVTLRKLTSLDDFPTYHAVVANTRIYDVSEVAKYLGVPLRSA